MWKIGSRPPPCWECNLSEWSAVLVFGMAKMPAYWRPDGDIIPMRHSIPQEAANAGSPYSSVRQPASGSDGSSSITGGN